MLRRLAFLIAGAAIVVGACSSGAPAAPALTDPKEILTKSVATLKDVKSFHLKADVGGEVKIDLTGQGSAGGALDLRARPPRATSTSRTRRPRSPSRRRPSSA